MSSIQTIEGLLTPPPGQFALIAGRFNEFIVEKLISGATDALIRHGVAASQITLVRVPGAFEMPVAAQALAGTKRYDALIALGAVIRGSTPHFDFVAGECVKGLSAVSLQHGLPVGFGVLTCDTLEQAIERAGTKSGNKGVDAALSALEMVHVLRNIVSDAVRS